MTIALIIFAIIAVLIALNGLYVAAEFSAVSSSRPRLAQMDAEGNSAAGRMLEIIEDPHQLDEYVAACQLGITVTSLVLGYYGQAMLSPKLANLLVLMGQGPELADSLATTLILIILTFFAVILGELIPKNLGVQMPERVVTALAAPMRWSLMLYKPLIWFFNGSGQLILRMMGTTATAEHMHVHSPEEIRMLVEESSEGGVLRQEERRLIVNTLELRNLTARKVMIPRNHMMMADVNLGSKELLGQLARSTYSRLPLYNGSVDKVIGMVHLKDLLHLVNSGDESDEGLRGIIRKVGFVPESMPAEGVLQMMQRKQNYVVIVADEYGGTAGMITVEDLFEEIIGEFDDEFDPDRATLRFEPNENRLFVHGDVEIDDVNEWTGLNLPTQTVNTIGGLAFSQLGKVPQRGDTVFIQMDDPDPFGLHADEDDVPQPDASTEPEGNESAVYADAPQQEAELRIEKMDSNSVIEVSIELTEEQSLKFRDE